MKLKKKVLIFGILVSLFLVAAVSLTLSAILENDVEVNPSSSLTYYLNVSYDGVDRYGVSSSPEATAEVKSGVIYVTDKIPNGLIFDGFEKSEDGSIGAVNSNGASCTGKVVDDSVSESINDYHGLHYDEDTRTVSFKVTNLQAGCYLTVGIKTITPTIDDPTTVETEKRRDFYNFATAKEGSLSVNSNVVHVFMGSSSNLHKVRYQYTGVVPPNAPDVPIEMEYAMGSNVGVAPDVIVDGYEFSGWSSVEVIPLGGSFTMPDSDVLFTGSFKKSEIEPHNVSYRIDGDIPPGYVTPKSKSYYEGNSVTVDKLKLGDVFNGYRFLGWDLSSLDVDDNNTFEMPDHDVEIVGKFELIKYTVRYEFYNTVLPPNYEDYLPEPKQYAPGDTVKLEDVLGHPAGYEFLGWYKSETFEMPEEDVVIYGEWKEVNGYFEPSISKEIIDKKDYYHPGDTVNYKITVTNNASFTIKDVVVREDNKNAYFISGSNYEVRTKRLVIIPTLQANASITIYARYDVTEEDTDTAINVVRIVSATADNNYELNTDVEYVATAQFDVQSKLTICKVVNGEYDDNSFQFKIVSQEGYDSWLTMSKNECKSIYLDPGKYNVTEIIPQEYSLLNVTGDITSNGGELLITKAKTYSITFENKFIKKDFFHSFGSVINKITGSE